MRFRRWRMNPGLSTNSSSSDIPPPGCVKYGIRSSAGSPSTQVKHVYLAAVLATSILDLASAMRVLICVKSDSFRKADVLPMRPLDTATPISSPRDDENVVIAKSPFVLY